MARKRTPGLIKRGDTWHIHKSFIGIKIRESTQTGSLKEAESYLAKRLERIRRVSLEGARGRYTFTMATVKYLDDYVEVKRSIAEDSRHIKLLLPFIGNLDLTNICDETLKPFIQSRKKDGVKNKTINLSLGLCRRILNLAARKWRENGQTWIAASPLLEMLPLTDSRKPYPLSLQEQKYLLNELPPYLQDMMLFKVNTGTREQEVCGLRWDWEVKIPELDTSVFIIPDKYVKNGDDRLVVLNRIAKSIVDKQRDKNPEYVFTCNGERLGSMNNTTWQRKRIFAALKMAQDSDECEYINISVSGRYLSLAWKICSKRIDEPEKVITFTVADYNKNRIEKGLEPVADSCRKEPDLKQLMRFKIIELFFAREWPEVEAFSNVRVHDLKHTYGRRLRAVGVNNETRKVLLGHRNGDITTHYSSAEVEELIEATEQVCNYDSLKSRTITLLRRKMG